MTASTTPARAARLRLSALMSADMIARVLIGICALSFLASGLFAMLAPEAFYSLAAIYPPFNRHFIHDIGAFMLGLGAGLGFALLLSDALLVALLGAATAAIAHFLSHLVDRDLGGLPTDPTTFGVFALILVGLTIWRLRRLQVNLKF